MSNAINTHVVDGNAGLAHGTHAVVDYANGCNRIGCSLHHEGRRIIGLPIGMPGIGHKHRACFSSILVAERLKADASEPRAHARAGGTTHERVTLGVYIECFRVRENEVEPLGHIFHRTRATERDAILKHECVHTVFVHRFGIREAFVNRTHVHKTAARSDEYKRLWRIARPL